MKPFQIVQSPAEVPADGGDRQLALKVGTSLCVRWCLSYPKTALPSYELGGPDGAECAQYLVRLGFAEVALAEPHRLLDAIGAMRKVDMGAFVLFNDEHRLGVSIGNHDNYVFDPFDGVFKFVTFDDLERTLLRMTGGRWSLFQAR